MLLSKQANFSKPMSGADGTLMMLLCLNLLLLVFFMLLNSMATYGQRHADEVMAEVRRGYELPGKGGREDVPEQPMEAWRANVAARLQGVIVNRLDLRVLPQTGNANAVEVMVPLNRMFDAAGQVLQPELVGNMEAAAGQESRVTWQVVGSPAQDSVQLAAMAASLAVLAGRADVVRGRDAGVNIRVVPGAGTRSGMGLQVQGVGEASGGRVQGVEETGGVRE